MKSWAVLLFSLTLAGSASLPAEERHEHLFVDRLFPAPSEHVGAADVFAMSDAMKHYLNVEIAGQLRAKGNQRGLIDALYSKGQLKLEYDSVMTRNASQAFDARSGNCLSLVIMTAAFAREIGLPVRYQTVFVDETWGPAATSIFPSGTSI